MQTAREYHDQSKRDLITVAPNNELYLYDPDDEVYLLVSHFGYNTDETCPRCGGHTIIIKQKLICAKCRTIVATCCD